MLKEYSTELEQAVYRVVYYSKQQRTRRALVLFLIILKHSLRSCYLMWPIYLLIIVAMVTPLNTEYVYYFLALLPGLLFWCILYFSSVYREYIEFVEGRLLVNSDFKKVVSSK